MTLLAPRHELLYFGGSHSPTRSQCQASRRIPVRGSFRGLNCNRLSGRPTIRPYSTSRARSVDTRCAIFCPFHT